MTGTRWLYRAKQLYGTGPDLRKRIERRINRKVAQLHPDEAKRLLQSFAGLNSTGSRDLQVRWVGGWSQSLDHHLRMRLGLQMRKNAKGGLTRA